MKLMLIVPTPELPRYAFLPTTNSGPRFHLLLSHLCSDPQYVEFYQHRRAAGDYLILDNGADELAEGQGLQKTLTLARGLRAQEVVLPDVQLDGDRTLENTLQALLWLKSNHGREAYSKAGRPRLMVVPQGKEEQEWLEVAVDLIKLARETMEFLGGPTIVVGVAKQYADRFLGGRMVQCNQLRTRLTPAEDVHLLGWPYRLAEPFEVSCHCPWVRSIDSAKPLVYSLAGIKVDIAGNTKYPLRPDNYFETPFPDSDRFGEIMRHNLAQFDVV